MSKRSRASGQPPTKGSQLAKISDSFLHWSRKRQLQPGISEGGRDETDDEGKAGRGDDGLALGVAGVAGEWGGVGVWRAVED